MQVWSLDVQMIKKNKYHTYEYKSLRGNYLLQEVGILQDKQAEYMSARYDEAANR